MITPYYNFKNIVANTQINKLVVCFIIAWVFCMLLSLKYGGLDPFFWAAQHAKVQGIDYFALPKSFLNLLEHRSPYDSWHGIPYGPYATWYLAHPVFSILVMPWFSFLLPWTSYIAFVIFSLLIMVYCASLFVKRATNSSQKYVYYVLFLVSFPLYWMLYVGNMHAPLVFSLTLIYLAIYDMLEQTSCKKKYNAQLLVGLLCSFFSKPIVILFIPALLFVKETRRTMSLALLIYATVSFIFIMLPPLNPEGVGLVKLFPILFDFDYIKESMNIYKNNFILTAFMKDNSIHWLNLVAQSGYRLNHIENFSFPVFFDTLLGQQLSSGLYNTPIYFCLLISSFIGFIRQRAVRLQLLLLTLMMASLSYFLSYNTVWEYQFTSIAPLVSLIFLQKNQQVFTPTQLRAIFLISSFFYLPSTYFLLDQSSIELSSITFIRGSRAIPALILFLLFAYQATKIMLNVRYRWPKAYRLPYLLIQHHKKSLSDRPSISTPVEVGKYLLLLIAAMVIVSVIFVITLLYRCHFGIDMTDEGYYLNWISNPWLYKSSATQFGYIYHPLYQLVGENIVRLRQADILIMLGLSWIVCAQLLRYVLHDESKAPGYPAGYLYGLAFALATCVFSFFGAWWWIPTPSYNSLTLEALLITVTGLLSVSIDKNRLTGWVIIGIGWWLTFMAKPTSAILLGLFSVIYLFSIQYKSLPIRHLMLSLLTACGLFFLSAWIIDGSIYDFITRLQQGAENMSLLYEEHSFNFFPQHGFLPEQPLLSILVLLTAFICIIMRSSIPKVHRVQNVCFFLILLICLLMCGQYYLIPLRPNPGTNILLLAIPASTWLTWVMMPTWRNTHRINWQYGALAVFFVLLPYVFSLGTHGDVWTTSLRMGLFWILAAIALIAGINKSSFIQWRILITIIISGQFITISMVQLAMEYPYRQTQSLRTQSKSFDIINTKGRLTSQLTIADDDSRYLKQLKQIALRHGFSYGDSMIDLTGAFPTALYLLGAKAVGAPWYIAGFGGSTDLAVSILSQTPCHELANAWVLTSLNGTEKYDPSILSSHGIDQKALLAIDEIIDARFNLKHQLMKPTRPWQESVLICEQMRKNQNKAQVTLQRMLKNKISSSKRIIRLSQIYIDNHQLDNAIVLLENALSINPHNSIYYNNLCIAYALQKKYTQATLACSKALTIDPSFQLARNNLAWVKEERLARIK